VFEALWHGTTVIILETALFEAVMTKT